MNTGERTCWCVRFQTRNNSGRLIDINSMIFLAPRCLGTGWGHDSPGHFRHVHARSAVEALQLALGLPLTLARQWLEKGSVHLGDSP